MKCSLCGGRLEQGGRAFFDRCAACGNLMSNDGKRLKPILVVAPGETHDEAMARFEEAARAARERSLDALARPRSARVLDRLIAWLVIAIVILLGVYAIVRVVRK